MNRHLATVTLEDLQRQFGAYKSILAWINLISTATVILVLSACLLAVSSPSTWLIAALFLACVCLLIASHNVRKSYHSRAETEFQLFMGLLPLYQSESGSSKSQDDLIARYQGTYRGPCPGDRDLLCRLIGMFFSLESMGRNLNAANPIPPADGQAK